MMPSPLPPSEEVVCDARRESNALQAATVPTGIHARRNSQVSEARFHVHEPPLPVVAGPL
jgi:hypothetical protein